MFKHHLYTRLQGKMPCQALNINKIAFIIKFHEDQVNIKRKMTKSWMHNANTKS
jgi:hypothetical protein